MISHPPLQKTKNMSKKIYRPFRLHRSKMDAHAKTVAISFVKWFYDEGWQPYDSTDNFLNLKNGKVVVSIERLFELYEKENI